MMQDHHETWTTRLEVPSVVPKGKPLTFQVNLYKPFYHYLNKQSTTESYIRTLAEIGGDTEHEDEYIIGISETAIDSLFQCVLLKKRQQRYCRTFIDTMAKEFNKQNQNADESASIAAHFELFLPLISTDENKEMSDECVSKFFPKTKGDRILPLHLLPDMCNSLYTRFRMHYPAWLVCSCCIALLTRSDTTIVIVQSVLEATLLKLCNTQNLLTESFIKHFVQLEQYKLQMPKIEDIQNVYEKLHQLESVSNKVDMTCKRINALELQQKEALSKEQEAPERKNRFFQSLSRVAETKKKNQSEDKTKSIDHRCDPLATSITNGNGKRLFSTTEEAQEVTKKQKVCSSVPMSTETY